MNPGYCSSGHLFTPFFEHHYPLSESMFKITGTGQRGQTLELSRLKREYMVQMVCRDHPLVVEQRKHATWFDLQTISAVL